MMQAALPNWTASALQADTWGPKQLPAFSALCQVSLLSEQGDLGLEAWVARRSSGWKNASTLDAIEEAE